MIVNTAVRLLLFEFSRRFCSGCSRPPVAERALSGKIGQILIVGFRGEEVDENSPVVRDLQEFYLGGVVLFV